MTSEWYPLCYPSKRDYKAWLYLRDHAQEVVNICDDCTKDYMELMQKKNHDYGEAWRDMRVSSLTDLILSKVLRIKQIEDNAGLTLVSEGIEGNYFDMLNYSVFALIHLQ